MSPCPHPSELESFAAGSADSDVLHAHIAACQACREMVELIRANQKFLAAEADALLLAADTIETAEIRLFPQAPIGIFVAGYTLIQEISRGGQGIVYRAVQNATKRPAAVKMLLGGAFATDRQRQRFDREVEIAARLRHPNIVSVFESGQTPDGNPYVAMEFVEGVPLDQYAKERLDPKPRIAASRARIRAAMHLMWMIAAGVGHAHTAGVIHRDLKPSNILVDKDGNPRVLDFGLARLANPSHDVSTTREFVGTPAYASPEQFQGSAASIDTRTDVYSLGMILYHVLTGRHPYPCDGSLPELANHAISTEPTPPSRYVPRLPMDVETIVLKCLSKDATRRYPNASALASDIDDYLNSRPVSARRDSTMYVLRKLALRHRIPALAALAALLTIVGAVIGLLLLVKDLNKSRDQTEAALSASKVREARLMAGAGSIEQAETLLWTEALQAGMRTDDDLCIRGSPEVLRSAWALSELYARLPRLFRASAPQRVLALGIDPAKHTIWAVDNTGSRWTWALDCRLLDQTPSLFEAAPYRTLVTDSSGRYILILDTRGTITLQDLQTRSIVAGPVPWPSATHVCGISDDLQYAIIVDEGNPARTLVLDGRRLTEIARFDEAAVLPRLQRLNGRDCLITGAIDQADIQLTVREAPGWNPVHTVTMPASSRVPSHVYLRSPSVSPDGLTLVLSVLDNIFLFDLTAPHKPRPIDRSVKAVLNTCRFDEHGRTLAAGSLDGSVYILRTPDLGEISVVPNGNSVDQVAIRDDLRLLAVGDDARRVSVYETSDRPWLSRIPSAEVTKQSIASSPQGAVAWVDDAGALTIRPGQSTEDLITIPAHSAEIATVAFSSNGEQIATAGFDGLVKLWRADGSPVRTLTTDIGVIWCVRYSPDGRVIAAGGNDGAVQIWSLGLDTPAITIKTSSDRTPAIAFSADGSSLATAAAHGQVEVWDVASGARMRELVHPVQNIRTVAVSPDGKAIVTGADDCTLRVWDASTGELLRAIQGMPWAPFDLRFHPDGQVLFVVGRGGEVVVVDPIAGVELATFSVSERLNFSLAISPDGRYVYTSGQDPSIGIIDLDRLRSYIRGNEQFWKQELAPK
ncbi:MAG: protein kinase [Phycisphaerales bacterium]|nr:protein kinase [Phycisphaerales bacterium]